MDAAFEVDATSLRNLEEVMARYAARVDHSAIYAVNRTLQNVAGWAAHETIMADKAKVAAELGATYRTINKRTGAKLPRPKPTYTPTTLAKARYAANLRRAGKPIPPEPIFSQNVKRMIASIMSSIAFMKAGWRPAFNKLRRAQGDAALNEQSAFGGRQREGYGGVIPARTVAEGISGEIYNVSINPVDPGSWPALERYGGEGLNAALELKRDDMERFLEREHDRIGAELKFA